MFVGIRNEDLNAAEVYVRGLSEDLVPLNNRSKCSRNGFDWGFDGKGPSDLAKSILWEVLGYFPELSTYQQFKREFIERAPYEGFHLAEDDIREWLKGIRMAKEAGNIHAR